MHLKPLHELPTPNKITTTIFLIISELNSKICGLALWLNCVWWLSVAHSEQVKLYLVKCEKSCVWQLPEQHIQLEVSWIRELQQTTRWTQTNWSGIVLSMIILCSWIFHINITVLLIHYHNCLCCSSNIRDLVLTCDTRAPVHSAALCTHSNSEHHSAARVKVTFLFLNEGCLPPSRLHVFGHCPRPEFHRLKGVNEFHVARAEA